MAYTLKNLDTIQQCLDVIKKTQIKMDEVEASELSDVWNALLDYRSLVINGIANITMWSAHGLREEFVHVLNTDLKSANTSDVIK